MPLSDIPWWANAAAGLISGGALAKLIDAVRARGESQSNERLTLQQSESKFRAMLIEENRSQRERLDRLEERVMELVENERKCDERNRDLEAEIITLRDLNDELRRDINALTTALDDQSRRIISDRESLRSLREGVAHSLEAQKARHGS